MINRSAPEGNVGSPLEAKAESYESIRRLVALYTQLLDDQRFEDLSQLFTHDGVLPWDGQTFTGPEEIVRGLPSTQPPKPGLIRHFVFSPVIDVDGDEARAWSDIIVSLVPAEGPAEMSFVGRYHDRFRYEDGRWRVAGHITVRTGDPVPDGVDPVPAH
jgi:hypothetical protein